MSLRGLATTEDLSRAWGLPTERVQEICEHPERMLMSEGVMLRDRLGVRSGWVFTGKGAMLPVTASPEFRTLVELLAILSAEETQRLVKFGNMLKLHSS